MKTQLLVLSFFFTSQILAQENLQVFDNLIGAKWEVKGKWSNGESFNQEYLFEWGLGKKMVKVKTYGTVNPVTGEYGLRNEGIRVWNEANQSLKFYEFDVFGGITEGMCILKGKSILYEYEYDGGTFRESWNYIDDSTYELVVEQLEDGKTKEVYQTSTIRRIQ